MNVRRGWPQTTAGRFDPASWPLIACRNPLLRDERRREALLAATEADLEKIVREAARRTRTPLTAAAVGEKVGRALGRHKMGKHVLRLAHRADGIRGAGVVHGYADPTSGRHPGFGATCLTWRRPHFARSIRPATCTLPGPDALIQKLVREANNSLR